MPPVPRPCRQSQQESEHKAQDLADDGQSDGDDTFGKGLAEQEFAGHVRPRPRIADEGRNDDQRQNAECRPRRPRCPGENAVRLHPALPVRDWNAGKASLGPVFFLPESVPRQDILLGRRPWRGPCSAPRTPWSPPPRSSARRIRNPWPSWPSGSRTRPAPCPRAEPSRRRRPGWECPCRRPRNRFRMRRGEGAATGRQGLPGGRGFVRRTGMDSRGTSLRYLLGCKTAFDRRFGHLNVERHRQKCQDPYRSNFGTLFCIFSNRRHGVRPGRWRPVTGWARTAAKATERLVPGGAGGRAAAPCPGPGRGARRPGRAGRRWRERRGRAVPGAAVRGVPARMALRDGAEGRRGGGRAGPRGRTAADGGVRTAQAARRAPRRRGEGSRPCGTPVTARGGQTEKSTPWARGSRPE